ncbi:hypothetical protein SH661x_001014 [Planctomicrobium sp. SH661]|uniref:hypothetical protein n=1 Tax=Planctomicrobium sp. SH661 TaxID=3448124 RepID=UPI003F5C979A
MIQRWINKAFNSIAPLDWIVFPEIYSEQVEDHLIEFTDPDLLRAKSETDFGLTFTPQNQESQRHYSEAIVIFNSTTMLPWAMRIESPDGNDITVISLTSLRPNAQIDIQIPDLALGKPEEGQPTR